ncbi:purine-cytosine permease family protein [Pseudomonas sp. NFX224]|uniref:purine-cytosine permease family protein n=1 Tax=Pseudomonas sp. NFX224 TaxID=3402862 RepID=UPI003AFB0E0B
MSTKTSAVIHADVHPGTTQRTLEVETRSFEFVPLNERHGTVKDQQKFWFMANASLMTLFSGAVGHQFGLGLFWTFIAIAAGSFGGTIFQALHAAQGPVMGIPQMIQSRVQFGARGALVPLLAAMLVLCGFPLFGILSGASALHQIAPIGMSGSVIVAGVAAVLVAIYGYRLLIKSEKIVAYIVCANFLILTVAVVVIVPWSTAGANGWSFNSAGLLAQLGASAMLQLGIAPLVSDYTRYLPTNVSGLKIIQAVFGGTMISALWLSFIGAVIINAFPGVDAIESIRQIGNEFGGRLGTITMIVAIPASLLAAATGIYSCGVCLLSGAEAFRHFETTKVLRTVVLMVLGLIIIAAGLVLPDNIVGAFGNFLSILGYFLIPWTAVNLVDFYVVRKGAYSITDILHPDGGFYGRWAWDGLVSYALGFVAMTPFFSTALYTGPIAQMLGGADIAFAVGLPVSCISYLIFTRSFNTPEYREKVAAAPLNTLGTSHSVIDF